MSRFWSFILAIGVVVALGGMAAGFVAAQEDGTETPAAEATATPSGEDTATPAEDAGARVDHYLEVLAGNLGISVEELEQALRETQLDLLDEAVAEGRIDEERAAEIRARIESGETPLFPFGPKHGRVFHIGASVVRQTAEFLGIEPQAVVEALQGGATLAEVAEANGQTADALAAYLLAELEEYLQQAVENGRISQARADEILANAPERIENLINQPGPFRPHRLGPDGAPGGFMEPALPPLEEGVFF
jgi:hypothetical protein